MKNTILVLFSIMVGCATEDGLNETAEIKQIRQAIGVSTWTLVKADVLVSGFVYTYNADCDFSIFNELGTSANAASIVVNDMNYYFKGSNLGYEMNCTGYPPNSSEFTLYEVNGKYFMKYPEGGTYVIFEFVTPVSELNGTSVMVKKLAPLTNVVSEVTLTFYKEN
jgi:hypothetical protein